MGRRVFFWGKPCGRLEKAVEVIHAQSRMVCQSFEIRHLLQLLDEAAGVRDSGGMLFDY
jgi:hypothetical protein